MDKHILNSRAEILKIDEENVIGSVEALADQCKDAFTATQGLSVPDSYKDYKNILMSGMGGSGLAGRVIESVYASKLPVPLARLNNYHLPEWVDEKTLVICSSYSGTTEETIQNAKEAIDRKSKWIAIGKGGELIEMAKANQVPFYQIEPIHNPSNQPRMAVGYSIIGQLSLLSKTGIISFDQTLIDEIVAIMKEVVKDNAVEVENAPAKELAQKMKGKIIAYISSNHLVGAMHAISNQLNENAKNFSSDYEIPELNHHLMEGLKHPKSNSQNLLAFFASSNLYEERVRDRHKITEDVVTKNNIESYTYQAKAKSPLAQVFEVIQFGAYANAYLSTLYGQNSAPIPWVDYFKTQLGQPLGK